MGSVNAKAYIQAGLAGSAEGEELPPPHLSKARIPVHYYTKNKKINKYARTRCDFFLPAYQTAQYLNVPGSEEFRFLNSNHPFIVIFGPPVSCPL